MKIAKHISFIVLILCAFVLLCACENHDNPTADNSRNPPSNGATDESLPPDEYESGEYPANFAGLEFWYTEYEFQVGQITDEFKMARLTEGIFYDPEKASFEATSENPDIVEIISCDPDALMDYPEWGGITVKCHKPGVSKIYVTITYLPTGGTKTIEATVTVTVPAETAE